MQFPVSILGKPIPGEGLFQLPIEESERVLQSKVVIATPSEVPILDTQLHLFSRCRKNLLTAVTKGLVCMVFLEPYAAFYEATSSYDETQTDEELDLLDVQEEDEDEELDIRVKGSNYSWLPVPAFVQEEGVDIEITSKVLASLLERVKPYLCYFAVFEKPFSTTLATNSEGKPIAGLVPHGKGMFIFLPALDWSHPDLFDDVQDEVTPKGIELADFIVETATNLRKGGSK